MEFKGSEGEWYVSTGVGGISVHVKRPIAGIEVIAVINEKFKGEEKHNALLMSKSLKMLRLLEHLLQENMLSYHGDELVKELIKDATKL